MNQTIKMAMIGLRGIPANYGGFETFAEELAPRLVDRGFQVTVYGRANNIDYQAPFYKGVRVKVLPTIAHKYLDTVAHSFLASAHAAMFEQYDIVLMVNAANAPFAAICRMGGAKVLLNVDGIERLRKKWGVLGKAYYRVGEWLATRLPNAIVADAQSIASYYQNKYSTASHLIAYGANTQHTPPGNTLQKLGLAPNEYLLYVTRLEPENNPDKVIRGYAAVESKLPLVIVGDAPYASRYKRELHKLAAADDRVILAGGIYGAGYRELISNAKLYVQATEVGGTHPALIEAMAVGNCVLANEVPEHQEVLTECGLIYKKNNILDMSQKMTELLNNDTLREQLAKAARQRIEDHYSWSAITKQYADVMLQMCNIDPNITAAESL